MKSLNTAQAARGRFLTRRTCGNLAGLAMVSLLAANGSSAMGQTNSLTSLAATIASNGGDGSYLSYDYTTDGSFAGTSWSQNFTGLDASGHTQTMNFNGAAGALSDYGSLHCNASGTVTNTYYNAANPVYVNSSNQAVNPAGSPDSLFSVGRANFNDTLQYGGTFSPQYNVYYIFHVDGTNAPGGSSLTQLSVTISDSTTQTFTFSDLNDDETVATTEVPFGGADSQTVAIYLQAQFGAYPESDTDGSTDSGYSDFSDTATLSQIVVVDSHGNPVSGVTISSASGTVYPVPEPASIACMIPVAIFSITRRRRVAPRL